MAAILLRDELKFDVEFYEGNLNAAPFDLLAGGQVDADFEVWPLAKDADYKRWVKEGAAHDAGYLGIMGREGIFVPSYAVGQSDAEKKDGFVGYHRLEEPSLWEGLSALDWVKGAAEADPKSRCTRSDWNCTDFVWSPAHCNPTPCDKNAQIIKDEMEINAGLLEQQISAFKLNISVVYTPDAQYRTLIWEAFSKRKPILIYGWSPRDDIFGIPYTAFTKVSLPPLSNCTFVPESAPTSELNCEAASTALLKVVSPHLASEKDALYLAERLYMSEENLVKLLSARSLTKPSQNPDYAAACMFVRQHEDLWRPWVHFTKLEKLTLEDPCWSYVWAQLAAFTAIAFTAVICVRCSRELLASEGGGIAGSCEDLLSSAEEKEAWLSGRNRSSGKLNGLNRYLVRAGASSVIAYRAVLEGHLTFMSHTRKELNFTTGPLDGACAPPGPPLPMRGRLRTKFDLLFYLLNCCVHRAALVALLISLLCSAAATAVHMQVHVLETNRVVSPKGLENFERISSAVYQLCNTFSFLPVFFMGMFVSRDVERWLEYVNLTYSVRNVIEDLSILLAGLAGINDPSSARERRGYLFRFYRWFNSVHYLTYYNHDARFGKTAFEALSDLLAVGLLEPAEVRHLLKVPPAKMRPVIIGWISDEWQTALRAQLVHPGMSDDFVAKLSDLRRSSNMYREPPASLVKAVMKVVTFLMMFFVAVAYPLNLHVEATCFQWLVMMATFLVVFTYTVLVFLMAALETSPFLAQPNCVNVDVNLCNGEWTCFFALTSRFQALDGDEPLGPAGAVKQEDVRGAASLNDDLFGGTPSEMKERKKKKEKKSKKSSEKQDDDDNEKNS